MDGIIFDVDGTLWDATGVIADAWTDYLKKEEGLDISVTADWLKTMFGMLLKDIADQILPEISHEKKLQILNNLLRIEHEVLARVKPPVYEGIPETLKKLSTRYPLFIVSNCQAGYIELFLERTNLGSYVTDHLCPGDTGEVKAENIRRIVEKHKLSAPVYVGDTLWDYEACQKAGVPFVFASYGYGEVPNPDYQIQYPAELLNLFI